MNGSNAKISQRAINQAFTAIDIEGELTAFAENDLMDAFKLATSNEGVAGIILNFSQLEYMTSSGIGLLVTLFIRASRQHKQLYAVGLSPHYQRIFTLTKLNETIRVFESEAAAMEQTQGEWRP